MRVRSPSSAEKTSVKGQTSMVTSEIAGTHRVRCRVDFNDPGPASSDLMTVGFICRAKKTGFKFREMES